MKPVWMVRAAFPLVALTLWQLQAVNAQQQDAPSDSRRDVGGSGGRLIRVAPHEDETEQTFFLGGEEAPFEADTWLLRLTEADLDRREAHFEEVVQLARHSDAAQAWLEERAADPADPELAWTARLALREVERSGRFGLHGFFGGPGGPHGWHVQPPNGGMWQRLEELLEDDSFRLHLGPHGLRAPTPGGPAAPGTGSHQRSEVSIQMDDDGVSVVVTEEVDGEETRREYTADSMAELLEAHPELRDELGAGAGWLGGSPGHQGGLRFHFGDRDGGAFEWLPFGSQDRSRMHRGAAPSIRTDILGVYLGAVEDARRARLGLAEDEALLVIGTAPGTIASVLGIASGAVLVEIDGERIDDRDAISRVLSRRPADGELTVVWFDARDREQRGTWRPAQPQADDQ